MSQFANETAALKRELESSLLSDLHTLDEHALRTRVTQLMAEIFERTKWEGIRMSQALKQVETELSRKYMDLMTSQRAELELEVNRITAMDKQATLDEMVKLTQKSIVEYEQKLQSSLREMSNKFQKELDERVSKNSDTVMATLNDDANLFVAKMREAHIGELIKFQNNIEIVIGQLRAFDKNLQSSLDLSTSSQASHQEAAALLVLESIFVKSEPLGPYLDGLREAVRGDPLVVALIDSIPEEAKTKGVLTDAELR
jgi:hypothetical protein